MRERNTNKQPREEALVSFTLNNRQVSVDADPRTPLLWAIRDHVGLTGTKYGCGAGLCGACTVHINGKAQRSCQVPAKSVEGATIVTTLRPATEPTSIWHERCAVPSM